MSGHEITMESLRRVQGKCVNGLVDGRRTFCLDLQTEEHLPASRAALKSMQQPGASAADAKARFIGMNPTMFDVQSLYTNMNVSDRAQHMTEMRLPNMLHSMQQERSDAGKGANLRGVMPVFRNEAILPRRVNMIHDVTLNFGGLDSFDAMSAAGVGGPAVLSSGFVV